MTLAGSGSRRLWKLRKVVGGLLGPLILLVALPAPASAYPRPGITERMSVGGAAQGDGQSWTASVSDDGRYVAFGSEASNLVPGDTNEAWDVFVSDRATETIERVSVGGGGVEGNGDAWTGSISAANGRYVAFASSASNLVPDDTNGTWDVFVHDRETKTTERVSVGPDGTQANSSSVFPHASADGRYVAFYSLASNLVPGDTNDLRDIFVHDRETKTTELVSVASDGAQANDASDLASISADGRHVAFQSGASNLVPGDTNETWDIFVRDRETGVTERVSVGSDGAQGDGDSFGWSISANGRFVAFHSSATNLVPGDTNGVTDVFVHNRQTGGTELVSVGSDGALGLSYSFYPSISGDGRYVAFHSFSLLVPGDTNRDMDVFVHDRETGATQRVSVASDGTEGNTYSTAASVSANGRYVAFQSAAPNLVPGDTNGAQDVFVRDRGPAVGVGGLSAISNADQTSVSGWATFSGKTVASAADPADDGGPGAEEAGAELIGASFIYRPEHEDLLARLRLASLPGVARDCPLNVSCTANTGAGAPGVLYGLRFDLGQTPHEVRAVRGVSTAAPVPPPPDAAKPYFALYRCNPDCIQQDLLSGGIGTTGAEVRVSVPLAALGAQEGATITGLEAFTAIGNANAGALEALDEVDLPDAVIPARQLSLGIARSGKSEQEVVFAAAAEIMNGSFSGTLDPSSLPAGDYEVWARACLGEECGATSAPFRLG